MPTSDWYEYLVNQDVAQPSPGTPVTATPSISAFIQNLNPGQKYYAHLRSFCLAGSDSSYWKVDSFVTKQFCGAPEVSVSGVGTNNISASWPAVADAVAYEYVINSIEADPAFGQEITITSVSNITLDADGKNKYLHVRTKCNSQFSFSAWVTEPLRLVPDNIEGMAVMPEIEVYPNPANNVLILTVHGRINANNATIIITDITGRQLSKIPATGNKNYIDLAGLSSGVYVVKYVEDGITKQSLFQKK
jgi:hypothetical protein